jgi:multidrug efflux pump subunit AcrA (membrane-fusion protein)
LSKKSRPHAVVEKEQALLKIDHEQVLEQKKQAEANRDARRAQLEQAKLHIDMTEKQQASQITQDRNAVEVAKAALESLEANTRQRITEAETQISTTQNGESRCAESTSGTGDTAYRDDRETARKRNHTSPKRCRIRKGGA